MTKIEWTATKNPDGTTSEGKTWNIISGCTIVSTECRNCYAMKRAHMLQSNPKVKGYDGVTKQTATGPKWTGKINLLYHKLYEPLKWHKGTRIFVESMGDLFHEDVPFSFINEVFAVMALCPQHTFLVLTKRSDRMKDFMLYFNRNKVVRHISKRIMEDNRVPETRNISDRWPLPNVWMGTSVGDQVSFKRIEDLLATPAYIRFLSCEPLLEELYIGGYLKSGKLHWVIVGGESGNTKDIRPMNPDWVRNIRDECCEVGVSFFFKQWGNWRPAVIGELADPNARIKDISNHRMINVGKKKAGNLLDGRQYLEYPDLPVDSCQVQE